MTVDTEWLVSLVEDGRVRTEIYTGPRVFDAEMERIFARIKGLGDLTEQRLRTHELFYGPGGFGQPDDAEIFEGVLEACLDGLRELHEALDDGEGRHQPAAPGRGAAPRHAAPAREDLARDREVT